MDTYRSKRQKRISRKQEEGIAEEIDGQTTAGSGAARFSGGADVRKKGEIRVEAKYTENKSYVLKLETLEKLRIQAARGGAEQAVLQIGFKRMGQRDLIKFAVRPWLDVITQEHPQVAWMSLPVDKKSVRLSLEYLQGRCFLHRVLVIHFPAEPPVHRSYYVSTWQTYLEGIA